MESLAHLAPVGVSLLIAFLSYGSQILLPYVEPYDLSSRQTIIFNGLVACIWICYARACLLDPGKVPFNWKPVVNTSPTSTAAPKTQRTRWCKRCDNYKPPRSHHCKTCKRCIPKMDHHCPWTINCVSHRTLPSFMRFLFFATAAMTYLEYFLYERVAVLWQNRNLPSYLGPSTTQLVFLFIFIITNSLTLFAVGIMFLRSAWSLGGNITTIEGWEIDRHEVLLRRAKVLGGYLEGPDGVRIRIKHQEFPYDIGIWSNIVQGMYGSPLTWFFPLAPAPAIESGAEFEVNGFEDASTTWPPPDPDRISRRPEDGPAFVYNDDDDSNENRLAAFKARQQADISRLQSQGSPHRRRPFHERYYDDDNEDESESEDDGPKITTDEGEEAWRSLEGERLADFGVDEEVEFYDEDDVPLAQLIAQRRAKQQ